METQKYRALLWLSARSRNIALAHSSDRAGRAPPWGKRISQRISQRTSQRISQPPPP